MISDIGEWFSAHEANRQSPSFVCADGQMLWSVSWCIHIYPVEAEGGEEREKSKGICQNWHPAPALECVGPPWKAFILVLSSIIIRLLVYVPASMWFCYSLKYDQTKYVVSVVKTKLILLLSLSQKGAGFCIPFPVLGPVGCAHATLLYDSTALQC